MAYIFITPSWFFVYSIILEIFFAIITMIVSLYSFKICTLADDRQCKLFGFAFLFISASYILQAFMNFLILNKLDDDVSYIINMQNVALFNVLGIYAHALFFLVGLLILTYVTLKVKNARVFTLLLSILVISVFFSTNKIFLFYVLSSVLLVFTVVYYFMNYINNKKINTLIVLMAMIFLLFSTLHFMFAAEHEIYYVLGHILEFVAYLLILTNLILILKHGEKTR